MGLAALVADQIEQVTIGLLFSGPGFFRMAYFVKNCLQQHAIPILLFRKQRQKAQGWRIALRLRLFRQAGEYAAALLIILNGFAKEVFKRCAFSAVGILRFDHGPGA